MTTPAAVPPAQIQPRNSLGTAGFVVGLVGAVFSPIPIIGVVAWPLVIIGLVFSAIGMNRARNGEASNMGLAIAGLVLSAAGLTLCILWAAAFGKAVKDNAENPPTITVPTITVPNVQPPTMTK